MIELEVQLSIEETTTLEVTGVILRESVMAPAPNWEGRTRVTLDTAGAYWVEWLDDESHVWDRADTQAEAITYYEHQVREIYPIVNPATGACTWAVTDVAGVPTFIPLAAA